MEIPSGYSRLAVIGIAYKGDYDSTKTYKKLNAVYHEGSTYVAIIDNPVGSPTNDGVNWKYLAKGYISEDLDALTSLDTQGLLGVVGASVNAQDLVDKIAEILNDKEDSFDKNTAFNKNFETSRLAYQMNGTASVGTSENVARADHVHPSDTTKLSSNGDASNTTVDYTTKDNSVSPEYEAVATFTGGETQASLMTKVSQMAQNQRSIKGDVDTINGIVSNPNLLDNGWFIVNQRGQRSYTGPDYGFDRWLAIGYSDIVITKLDKGLKIIKNADETDIMYGIRQYVKDFDKLFGKTITISYYDGTQFRHATFNNVGNENKYVDDGNFRFGYDARTTSTPNIYFALVTTAPKNSEMTIECVKLELGSVSTLANDIAPNYDEELLRCMTSTADANDTYANKNLLSETTVNLSYSSVESNVYGGVTVIRNSDGTYTLNGTASADTQINCAEVTLKKGTYKVLGVPKGSVANNYKMKIKCGSVETNIYSDGIILNVDTEATYMLKIYFYANVEFSNLVFKPMITTNLNATYNDYVSYTGDTGKLNSDVAELRSELGNLFITKKYTVTVSVEASKGGNVDVPLSDIPSGYKYLGLVGTHTYNEWVGIVGAFEQSKNLVRITYKNSNTYDQNNVSLIVTVLYVKNV